MLGSEPVWLAVPASAGSSGAATGTGTGTGAGTVTSTVAGAGTGTVTSTGAGTSASSTCPALRTVDLAAFDTTSWIAPSADVTCFTMMQWACGLAGFRPRMVAESMDFAVQLELVAAGVGVALVPALTIAHLSPGVELLELAAPVKRSIHLAARAPDFADPGILTLAGILTETASLRLRVGPRTIEV